MWNGAVTSPALLAPKAPHGCLKQCSLFLLPEGCEGSATAATPRRGQGSRGRLLIFHLPPPPLPLAGLGGSGGGGRSRYRVPLPAPRLREALAGAARPGRGVAMATVPQQGGKGPGPRRWLHAGRGGLLPSLAFLPDRKRAVCHQIFLVKT